MESKTRRLNGFGVLVNVFTSVCPANEAKLQSLPLDLSATVARLLGKPEKYVMTNVVLGTDMSLGGSREAACLVEIKSIGGLTRETGARLTEAVSELVRDALDVPTNRVYVVCTDVPAHLWGFDGASFG
ncbi:MAG TPA: phenylpyruvate tautomerase MIF-related protein [Polyangiaceae bacterium]|nr:phenylpyruvate tautomerase MIF-related protein [Polyangiaceae bacterium]